MLEAILAISFNVLTALALIAGLFFMFVGAFGVVRLPDFYSRTHAASKCVTLGIAGLLAGLVLFVGVARTTPAAASGEATAELDAETYADAPAGEAPTFAATTKAILVLAFVFIAAPVGSHMLARAAHLAGVRPWEGTLSDELEEDRDGDKAEG